MCCKFFFYLILLLAHISCAGLVCEGKQKKVSFKHHPEFQRVDIAGSPTYGPNDSWVKKIFVEEDAFLLLTSQKTVKMKEKQDCDKQKENCLEHSVVSVYSLQTYKEKEGYKHWSQLTEEERLSIIDINSRLSRKPSFQASKCYVSSSFGLWDWLLIMMRV